MPIGPFGSFDECVARMGQEGGVDDPEAFCGWLENQSESMPGVIKHMDSLERKVINLQLKDDGEPGEFTARIATLGVIDADGDVTQPGAFPLTKDVLVSAYGHGSWEGALPVGKATIREDGPDVIATGVFNLASAVGRDTYETVKFSGPMQEWSYGFRAVDSVPSTQDGVPIRLIRRVDPFEISPVLKGAGIATSTLNIKADKDSTYGDNADCVLESVMSLIGRSKSLADLRAKEGRVLSASNINRLEKLRASLADLETELDGILDAAGLRDNKSSLISTKLEYLKLMARFNGVAV